MDERYFCEDEALALVRRRIRTRVPFSGVPEGTEGAVMRADEVHPGRGCYDVAIQWNLPGRVKPLVDGFSKEEYQRFLEEI
jgi:hypothetical protein